MEGSANMQTSAVANKPAATESNNTETSKQSFTQPKAAAKWEAQTGDSSQQLHTYDLETGLKLIVEGHKVVIYGANGKQLAKNTAIIRRIDENPNCPSEGFIQVVSKGIYFTIEQQNCSGWYFIDEYITFKYIASNGKILLHKFGLQYSDRRDPDKVMRDKIYSQKDFGMLEFDKVQLDSLYRYNR